MHFIYFFSIFFIYAHLDFNEPLFKIMQKEHAGLMENRLRKVH